MRKLTLIVMIMGVFIISNAQTEKIELKLTPEIKEKMFMRFKQFLQYLPEEFYSKYGIKNEEQLEHLQIGKPIPKYMIVNKKLETVQTWNVSRISDGEPLSLKFIDTWIVPVMADEAPLLFVNIIFSDFGIDPYISPPGNADIIEHFYNYEYKDSIIGAVLVTPSPRGMDHFIIRKENQDIFVEIYDEVTGEYLKNEYNFSELINHVKELDLRKKEAQMRYYDKVVNKKDLKITPEIEEMVINRTYRFRNMDDEDLPKYGIKNKAQLENLHIGKPIPIYDMLDNKNLTFGGRWQVPVMSGGEPLLLIKVKLENDGQYRVVEGGGSWAEAIRNYEHKNLIIGFLEYGPFYYLIIRKEDKDIFVKMYDYATHEYLKSEYSFSELINLLKK